jgi:tetrapyrrole methylase family protein/MazG family protein
MKALKASLANKEQYSFEDLVQIIKILRSDEGCPWDLEQTHETLKMDTIEEAYEVVDAINQKDDVHLKEELGDMLLHVVFHSQIATDDQKYSIDDVIDGIATKMVRRHPHVFGDIVAETSVEVLKNWEAIKSDEKENPTISEQMDLITKALPALMRSRKIQKKAAKVGFDFENLENALSKVYEELNELQEALNEGNFENIQEEYGDMLFSLVNISRFLGFNPELALTNATEKFINRFRGIEDMAKDQGLKLENMSLEAKDQLWVKYKTPGDL